MRPVRRADNLTTFICRLSWNLGTSATWNSRVLSWPVTGFLCFAVYRLPCVPPPPLVVAVSRNSAWR